MKRSYIAVLVGFGSLLLGLVFRANADSWARNNTRGHVTYSFDPMMHAQLLDTGAVFLGFGVLALAVALNAWVCADGSKAAA